MFNENKLINKKISDLQNQLHEERERNNQKNKEKDEIIS